MKELEELIAENKDFNIAQLEYALWYSISVDSERPQHNEKVNVKLKKDGTQGNATWDENDSVFWVDFDSYLDPWLVTWQQVYPANMKELAARKYLELMKKATEINKEILKTREHRE